MQEYLPRIAAAQKAASPGEDRIRLAALASAIRMENVTREQIESVLAEYE